MLDSTTYDTNTSNDTIKLQLHVAVKLVCMIMVYKSVKCARPLY